MYISRVTCQEEQTLPWQEQSRHPQAPFAWLRRGNRAFAQCDIFWPSQPGAGGMEVFSL